MTGSTILAELEAAGIRVLGVLPDDRLDAVLPDPLPREAEPLLGELRAHRAEVVAAVRARHSAPDQPHPCIGRCGAGAGPGNLFCPPCWQARSNVIPFDPDLRRRLPMYQGTSARACPTCGSQVRHVRSGDDWCAACAAPGPPRAANEPVATAT